MKKRKILIVIILIIIFLVWFDSLDNEVITGEPGETYQISSQELGLWQSLPNQQIVFMSRSDSQAGEIYKVDKGGLITRLTANTRHENNVALSPDGMKVAFHAGQESNPFGWEIFILDLETLEEIQLTHNGVLDGHPDWSPDGSKIIFSSYRDPQGNPAGVSDTYVINTDGTELRVLVDSDWEDNDAELSPDGTKIVFKSTRNTQQSGKEEIFVADSDGSNVRQLTNPTGFQSDHDPSWSPDSKTIAFFRFEGSRPWIDMLDINTLINEWQTLNPWNSYTVDLDGNLNKLSDEEFISGLPVFSKDGEKILSYTLDFIIEDNKISGGEFRLILMNPDGSNKQQLFPDLSYFLELEYFDW
jgi:TolB protein